MRTPIVGGNWKMNTDARSALALAGAVADGVRTDRAADGCEVVVFPPFVYLRGVADLLRERSSDVRLGAQDVYPEPDGAFTGEVSVAMLRDCGASVVLAGHSERRHVIGEDDNLVNRKVRAALEGGLTCVLCVGETLEEREHGQTDRVNARQVTEGLRGIPSHLLERLVIAYEPVWAIGTGRTATPADAQDAHRRIRQTLTEIYGDGVARQTRIQYGGSVKGANAADLMAQPDIDGGLIGGASLKADEFLTIVKAAAGAKRR
jgi:triosephosphate isomerase